MFYSFHYVWNIEISGNSKITNNEILFFLENNEIEIGIKKEWIDCSEIESLLRQEFNQIGWVSAYFDHTKLCVEVKESLYDEYNPLGLEENKRYDLIANKDAIIYSIVTRTGTSLVHKGERVKSGETLVQGCFEVMNDAGEVIDIITLKADALIYGDVSYNFKYRISDMEILSMKIADTYSDEMLLFVANHKLALFIEKLEQNGVIILDKNVMIEKKENDIMFSGIILTREQFGINIPVEEIWEYELE